MQNVLVRVRNPALRQGLIFGLILGVVLVALSFINNDLIITFALILLASFIAGLRASQETGRLTTGTLAGLWTGLIGILIPSTISIVLLLFSLDAYRKGLQAAADKQHLNVTYSNSQIIISYLIIYLILVVLGVLFGVVGGAVGGSFGRRRAQPSLPEVDQEVPFEPPVAKSSEASTSATQPVEMSSTIQSEESLSKTPAEEPASTNSLEEPSSSTQLAE